MNLLESTEEHVCVEWNADQFCVSCGLLPIDGNPDLSKLLRACPACNQEMSSPDGSLPVHMSRGALCVGSCTLGASPKFGVQIKEPLTIEAVGQLSISEIISADTCLACGGDKQAGQTLCARDHGLLPFLLRHALPTHLKGHLYIDEQELIDGHFTKREFMEVFQTALAKLAAIRSGGAEQTVDSNQQTAGEAKP